MSFYLPKGAVRPPRIARGEGVHLYDERGTRYLDATSGAVVSNLGHSNPRVVAAMAEQAHRVTFAYPRFFESEQNVRLAGKVTELAGDGFDRAFFVSGGSEANEAALKLARQYALVCGQPTRWKVISRDPSYHGSTMGAMAITGDSFTESIYGPMFKPMPKVPAPLTYRLQVSRLVGDVRGKGLLMAIELVADKETRRQLPPAMNAPARLTNYGLAHGIALYNRRANRGQFGDIQLIAPPLIITDPEIDDLVERLGRSLLDFERDLEREGELD